ncbi:hypothetical protein VTJ83DRAFT_5219 [Remersonia thermophila]|uniref:Uncharacterized protein n=1 Tax=Remersonia thermophila TaxID=72144 RepID=A0ABR4DCC9_9PEZI
MESTPKSSSRCPLRTADTKGWLSRRPTAYGCLHPASYPSRRPRMDGCGWPLTSGRTPSRKCAAGPREPTSSRPGRFMNRRRHCRVGGTGQARPGRTRRIVVPGGGLLAACRRSVPPGPHGQGRDGARKNGLRSTYRALVSASLVGFPWTGSETDNAISIIKAIQQLRLRLVIEPTSSVYGLQRPSHDICLRFIHQHP